MARTPKDTRPWVRLDQGFPDNQKVIGLSDAAFRLFIKSLCWSARNGTDGAIKKPVALALGAKPRTLAELVNAGLFDAIGHDYAIHDYLEHQESAEQVEKFRSARRGDGSFGAHIRHHVNQGTASADCEHCVGEGRLDVA